MTEAQRDLAATLFVLPPDARFVPVSDLSARLQSRIGPVEGGHSVITRPGFRVTTRLVPGPLADLIGEFRVPIRLTDAVLNFARAHEQDPFEMLDLAFDPLVTLVEARILVPHDSVDAAALEPTLGAGQQFAGVYEIEGLVRSLEDSEVYRARTRDGESVALKITRDDRSSVVSMLANEANILEILDGTDSPRLLDRGTDHGRAYIAMEWCDGVSIGIAAQQARASRDRRHLHDLVRRMFEAYARMHACSVLHGDVHPGNCLVRDDGRVVVLDFGHGRALDGSTLLVDALRSGIPQFHDPQMAAALLAGKLPPAATPASEQYAIAVLAYVLLTGLHPIETPAVHDEVLLRIVERSPLPFSARGVEAWPDVEAVIGRALARTPNERYADVACLAREFASVGRPPDRARAWPDRAQLVFESRVEDVRRLAPCADRPEAHAWFALRAALALDDAELLAAADVLARRAGSGWVAQAIAAQVARARSDTQTERAAIAGFLAAARVLSRGAGVAAALVAAADVLAGVAFRTDDVTALGEWASERLDWLMHAEDSHAPESAVMYAALALCKSGAMVAPPELPARLDALSNVEPGDVWLWAAAHDVLAEDRFKALALAAGRPRRALSRGLTFLRLHQVTGETRWVNDATRVLRGMPGDQAVALLVAELMAPERAILPPGLVPGYRRKAPAKAAVDSGARICSATAEPARLEVR